MEGKREGGEDQCKLIVRVLHLGKNFGNKGIPNTMCTTSRMHVVCQGLHDDSGQYISIASNSRPQKEGRPPFRRLVHVLQ